MVARRGSDGRHQIWQEEQGCRVQRLGRRRDRLMRQYEKFDVPTFVKYLEELSRKWGKSFLIMNNTSQHKTKAVREYLKEHDCMEALYLPTATPEPSVIEAICEDAKYRLVTFEHYEALKIWRAQCLNTLERAQLGSASTNSCTAACEAKFSMIGAIG